MDQGTLSTALNLLLLIGLVFLNGVFVAVEFAAVRSHMTKLRELEAESVFGIGSAIRTIENLNLSLSACQLGITIASLTLGWLGEKTLAELFLPLFAHFEPAGSGAVALTFAHAAATAASLLIVTVLHVLLGEVAAKAIAISYPETVLRYLAPSLQFFCILTKPFIIGLNSSANVLLRWVGLQAIEGGERVHSTTELSMLIEQSTEHGELDKSEEQMLKSVFGFSETVAREIMTPRPDIVAIPSSATFEDAVKIVSDSGLSRFPVLGESGIDDVVGVVLARDLLSFLARTPRREQFTLRTIMREAYFVPGTKSIDDLLNELKRRKVHLAIILDEHGGVDGIVTLEDIIEELVGEIYDESDQLDEAYRTDAQGDIILDAGLHVADVNERFGLKLPEGAGEYDTLAGFIFAALGRTAHEGDTVTLMSDGSFAIGDGDPKLGAEHESDNGSGTDTIPEPISRMRVEVVSGNRIESVRLHFVENQAASEPTAQAAES